MQCAFGQLFHLGLAGPVRPAYVSSQILLLCELKERGYPKSLSQWNSPGYNGVCEVLGLKKLFFPPENLHDYCVNNELHACILIWNYSVFSSLGKNELCWF